VVLVAVAGDRAPGQPELLGPVVRHHEERVRAVRKHRVLCVVPHPGSPSADAAWCAGRVVGVDDPHLARVAAPGPDHQQPTAPGGPEVHLEPFVGLLEHQRVLVVRRPDGVAPDLEGTVDLVVDGVEELVRSGAPGAAVVAARHLVGQVIAGVEITEAQTVDLVAGPVERVGEQPVVRTDHRESELEMAAVVGQLALVEQHPSRTWRLVAITQQLRVVPSRRQPRVVGKVLMSPTDRRISSRHPARHL
jgi:hypothetical protein